MNLNLAKSMMVTNLATMMKISSGQKRILGMLWQWMCGDMSADSGMFDAMMNAMGF